MNDNLFLKKVIPQLSPLAAKSLRQVWRSVSSEEQEMFSASDYDSIYASLSTILPEFINFYSWSKLNKDERLAKLAEVILLQDKQIAVLQKDKELSELNALQEKVIPPDALAKYKVKLLDRFINEHVSSTVLRGFYRKEFFVALPLELRKAICETILEYCHQRKIPPEKIWVDLAHKMGLF